MALWTRHQEAGMAAGGRNRSRPIGRTTERIIESAYVVRRLSRIVRPAAARRRAVTTPSLSGTNRHALRGRSPTETPRMGAVRQAVPADAAAARRCVGRGRREGEWSQRSYRLRPEWVIRFWRHSSPEEAWFVATRGRGSWRNRRPGGKRRRPLGIGDPRGPPGSGPRSLAVNAAVGWAGPAGCHKVTLGGCGPTTLGPGGLYESAGFAERGITQRHYAGRAALVGTRSDGDDPRHGLARTSMETREERRVGVCPRRSVAVVRPI